MPVIVMEVKLVEQHPNADALRIYSMAAPGYEDVQIIANLENVYDVGDRAIVALANSVLKDGTKIKPTKLRGMQSFGMAIGKTSEDIGSDLSHLYCQQKVAEAVELQKWPSIELLHNVRRSLDLLGETPKITYRAKIKLDGTNGGVQIFPDGRVAAQSRTQIITPESDNLGFAGWVEQNVDFFANMAGNEHVTLFGEWCGKGIQKRTAISQIDRKIFVVFAIQYGGVDGQAAKLEVNPAAIRALIPEHADIFALPFYGESIVLDFGDRHRLEEAIAIVNRMVAEIERQDPWVKETFEIEGLGEGLVMYPETTTLVERFSYSELLFKGKGEKHQVVKSKKSVQIDPELAESIDEFVSLFVTEPRLEQGVTEACDGEFDMKKIGVFIKWIVTDVQKEAVAELEKSQLTWKDVHKAVMNGAREWYRAKIMLP